MRTTSRTTYILLDRGSEDRKLLDELESISRMLGVFKTMEQAKKYPLFMELMHGLREEVEKESE